MIKKCVGYIWYCYLICFIDYIVSALLTLRASTLSIPCIFLNLLLIRIQGFLGEKLRKGHEIFTKIVMGNLGMSWHFFFISPEHPAIEIVRGCAVCNICMLCKPYSAVWPALYELDN